MLLIQTDAGVFQSSREFGLSNLPWSLFGLAVPAGFPIELIPAIYDSFSSRGYRVFFFSFFPARDYVQDSLLQIAVVA
jgi:hypothetical protein